MSNVELLHECKANMTVALLSLAKHVFVVMSQTHCSLKTHLVPMSTPSLEVDLSACSKIFTTSAASMVKTSAIWSMDIPFIPQELQIFNDRMFLGPGMCMDMLEKWYRVRTVSSISRIPKWMDTAQRTSKSFLPLLSLCPCTPFAP